MKEVNIFGQHIPSATFTAATSVSMTLESQKVVLVRSFV
jgi:hypothetical protein